MLAEPLMQEGVEHDERLFGRRTGRSFDDASVNGECQEPLNVLRDVRSRDPHMMDDVALDAAGSPVQPGHVNARQVEAPCHHSMDNGPRDMAERRCCSERVLYSPGPYDMSCHGVEPAPQIPIGEVAAPEAQKDSSTEPCEQVSILAARIERFCASEEPARLGELSGEVQV